VTPGRIRLRCAAVGDETETVDGLLAAVARIPPTENPRAIGRYRILRRLGAGGMGVVFEAEDPELGRKVAIKVLRERADTQLRREAQLLARLEHPNVIGVYDVGDHEGQVFVVMQLVDGVTLDRYLAKRSPAEILAAFVAAGRGLMAAHAAGIVHRDFKPSNVLVGRDGSIRVSDFGIAHGEVDLDPAAPVALTTASPIGTPAYMAPEQHARGEITPATDQFAFCVALWEALQGERPFAGLTMAALAEAVTSGARREPVKPMPRRVRAALIRGLSPRADDRFPAISALLDELVPRRRTALYAAVGGIAIAATVAAFAITRETSDPCDGIALRDWTPSLVTAAARGESIIDFVARWPMQRQAACRAGRTAEAACLDASLATLDRVLATPAWGSIRAELPVLDRCASNRAPTVTTIASRRTVGVPPAGLALGPDGRIAIVTPRRLEVLRPSGAHDSASSGPELDPADLYRWDADGLLWFMHQASLEFIDPANGATRNNRGLPAGTRAVSRDGKRVLAIDKSQWAVVTMGSRERSPIDASGTGGAAEWSPDDRRIAVITMQRGERWLRIIDARTRVVTDTAIRLDHGVLDEVRLAWLDSTHVVLNGRATATAGEGLWVTRIDDAGHAVAWEERVSASAGTAYRIVAVQHPRALAELQTTSDMLIRIGTAAPGAVSQTLAVSPRGGIEVSGDRALVNTRTGRGWIYLQTGGFKPFRVRGTGRVAVDREDRVLSILGTSLLATTASGEQRIGDVLAGSQVRCDRQGGCLTFTVGEGTTVVRTLAGATATFPIEAIDVALAPDGARVALTGPPDAVLIGDLRTGKHTYRLTNTFTCGIRRHTQFAAWYDTVLYVSVACSEGTAQIMRIPPGPEDATPIYGGAWVGNLAVTIEGEVLAIRRSVESQPVLIEGL
jgi:hypothetical protein